MSVGAGFAGDGDQPHGDPGDLEAVEDGSGVKTARRKAAARSTTETACI